MLQAMQNAFEGKLIETMLLNSKKKKKKLYQAAKQKTFCVKWQNRKIKHFQFTRRYLKRLNTVKDT